jgi:hypothetical protein
LGLESRPEELADGKNDLKPISLSGRCGLSVSKQKVFSGNNHYNRKAPLMQILFHRKILSLLFGL